MKNLNHLIQINLVLIALTSTACGGGGGGGGGTSETIPIEPSSLVASTLSASGIRLSWTDNSDNEDGFRVERSLMADTGFAEITTTDPDVVILDDTGLDSVTKYYYRVSAFNVAGASLDSNVATTTTRAGANAQPEPPTNFQASVLSSSQIKLTWLDNASNEDEYAIMHANFSGSCGSFSQIVSLAPDTTTYIHSGLASSSSHCYQVISKNQIGNGNSNLVEGVTTSVAMRTLTVARAGIGFGEITGPNNINCPGVCSRTFAHGSSITLTATPVGAGSSFLSWSGCNSTSGNQCTVIMNSNRSVTAVFSGNQF